ncbi:hypothetical protein K491DRAFT_450335 [Lophiostoma macrostomum CBS 122681]|uniref:Uncharacterized protein n=1 Tax=Lophiostoma macrostomum CBS 122681 TaxID=1314788 RepID=A0A6A6TPU3_9PLEO|nr:hypothetical protein K491DRAFT_450335 [Lophiostoma macrostomum CBS 122681]
MGNIYVSLNPARPSLWQIPSKHVIASGSCNPRRLFYSTGHLQSDPEILVSPCVIALSFETKVSLPHSILMLLLLIAYIRRSWFKLRNAQH